MRAIDPVGLVKAFLDSLDDIPEGSPTGDLAGREAGETAIYLEHSGGFRVVRDRMDRADIEYSVYHLDRGDCVDLATLCREHLLNTLPGLVIDGIEVLDVEDVSTPSYLPDQTSREHVYGGEVTLFYCEF
ncbi:hypothetical protein [Streptomyces decoyicus]